MVVVGFPHCGGKLVVVVESWWLLWKVASCCGKLLAVVESC